MIINVSQLTTTPIHSEENHATLSLNQWGRVVIRMDDGWVFWCTFDYFDDKGPFTPAPEDICPSRYGVFAPDTDFTAIIVVDESTIDPNQIYKKDDDQVTE